MLLLMWVKTFLAVQLVRSDDMTYRHYNLLNGYSISGGTALGTIQQADMSVIACARSCMISCGVQMFNQELRICVTFWDTLNDSTISLVKNSTWLVIYKDPLDSWRMVFRGQSSSGTEILSYWSSTGTQDDNPLVSTFPVSCLQFDRDSSCDRHFRSKVLDDWSDIEQIRYSLYKDGVEVHYIVFNGSQTTTFSWFDQSRILFSSWTSLRNNPKIRFFTLKRNDTWERIFYIHESHNGCTADATYSFILEKPNDICADIWPIQHGPLPLIVYSKTDSPTRIMAAEFGLADAMAVFVKFSPK